MEGNVETAPWFRRQPAVAVAVAAVLYAAVFVARLVTDRTDDAVVLFYVIPIALLAVAFGTRVGVMAAAVGVVLLAAWVVIDHVSLTATGWLARVTPMLLLGYLVGRAADRLEAAALQRNLLLVAQMREREAAEINDSIVQGLTAAKWSLELGQYDRSLELLTETMQTAQRLVAELLRDRPITPGALRREAPAPRTTDTLATELEGDARSDAHR